MRGQLDQELMGFFSRTSALLRGLLIRTALLLAAYATLIVASWVNLPSASSASGRWAGRTGST